MTTRGICAAVVLVSSMALGAPGGKATASATNLMGKVRQAYSKLEQARGLLGKSPTSTNTNKSKSLLSKAEAELNAVRSALPMASLVAKVKQARAALSGGSSSADSNASGKASGILGDLQNDAAKVDPDVASKLGQAQAHAQQGSPTQASSKLAEAEQDLKAIPIESAYEKVVGARTQLKSGKVSSARSTLATVPSLASLESSVTQQLKNRAMGGSGQAGSTAKNPALPKFP